MRKLAMAFGLFYLMSAPGFAKLTKRELKIQFQGVTFDTGVPFVGEVKNPVMYLKVYADNNTNKLSHLKFSVDVGMVVGLPAKYVFGKKLDMDRMKMLATVGTDKSDEGIFYLNKDSRARKFLSFRFKVKGNQLAFCNLGDAKEVCTSAATSAKFVKFYARNVGEKGWIVDGISVDGAKYGLSEIDQKSL